MRKKLIFRSARVVLPYVTAAGLFAANYTINVSADQNGNVNYIHKDSNGLVSKKGKKGHHFVKQYDQITWQCDRAPSAGFACTAVAIKFKHDSPCATPGQTCAVNSNLDIAIFPYTVAVSSGYGVAIDDPDVIVDNGSIGILGSGEKKSAPQAPKK
jgi:hypothetical protein